MKPFNNLIFNEERSFVFAYLPKVACTNWKCLLRRASGAEDWLDTALAHDPTKSGLRYVDPGLEDDRNLLASSAVAKYTMVRNPYTRILSAYLNKIESRKSRKIRKRDGFFDSLFFEVDTWRTSQGIRELDFGAFLRWLQQSESSLARNEHFAPQTDLLRSDTISYDLIGRFEAIERDSSVLLRAMGMDVRFPSQEDVRFPATRAETKLQAHYGDAEREIVADLYASDFLTLGYRP